MVSLEGVVVELLPDPELDFFLLFSEVLPEVDSVPESIPDSRPDSGSCAWPQVPLPLASAPPLGSPSHAGCCKELETDFRGPIKGPCLTCLVKSGRRQEEIRWTQ